MGHTIKVINVPITELDNIETKWRGEDGIGIVARDGDVVTVIVVTGEETHYVGRAPGMAVGRRESPMCWKPVAANRAHGYSGRACDFAKGHRGECGVACNAFFNAAPDSEFGFMRYCARAVNHDGDHDSVGDNFPLPA